jgi:tRNA (guanine37-N1)-methyltransferase
VRFDVITLFPQMFAVVSDFGITRRAHEQSRWQLQTWNPRDFTSDAHRTVDDRPFGGGPGMVMLAEPLAQAVAAAHAAQVRVGAAGKVIEFAPSGRPLTDAAVREWAKADALTLVCGRYEGIDQRFVEACVDEVVSIGDFVLSGGEIAALALIDAVVRQLPGALKEASTADESFAAGLLDGPLYTRPEVWRGREVPPVLVSGHHGEISRWRREQALLATRRQRPELLDAARRRGLLDAADERFLRAIELQSGDRVQGVPARAGAG